MLLAIGILLSLVGLGLVIAMIGWFATLALPLFIGAWAARLAFETGAGYLGAFFVGATAGALALGLGQVAFATLRWWPARLAVALLFAVPAAMAGYGVVYALSGIGMDAEGWRRAFGIIGAIATGFTALTRVASPAPAIGPSTAGDLSVAGPAR